MKAQPAGLQKRPNLLMTAGIGLTERDEKKELLYGLMGALLSLDSSIPITIRELAVLALEIKHVDPCATTGGH